MSQAMLTRAETKVKEMRQTVDILRNESKKLEVLSFTYDPVPRFSYTSFLCILLDTE